MNKITLTTFTDPMMGLSYECEPIMRKLETHFAGQIEFHYVMGLLVRNVHDFMMPEDYADTEAESIVRYNARLATDRFLYNLRYATIVDTRSTTRLDEILKVVSQTGIDEKRFLQHYRDSSAESASPTAPSVPCPSSSPCRQSVNCWNSIPSFRPSNCARPLTSAPPTKSVLSSSHS